MADPLGDNEMQRVCHGCVNPNKRSGSSADSAAGAASSKRPCPEGEGTVELPTQAYMDAVEEWLTIDSQEEVMKAVVDDLKEDIFDESLDNVADQILDSDDDDADSSAGDKSQAVDTPRPPPYTKVASQFGDLEGEAEKCNMAEVSYYLGKAKLAWMREFGLRKRKQTIMADFL